MGVTSQKNGASALGWQHINIVATGHEVGEQLVPHPGIDKVSFTGGTAAGSKIAEICGENLKRVSPD